MGGFGQMLTFAYIVGGWVYEDAYAIKRIKNNQYISSTIILLLYYQMDSQTSREIKGA